MHKIHSFLSITFFITLYLLCVSHTTSIASPKSSSYAPLWRLGMNYAQINIPKVVNNLGAGFAYPIYHSKRLDVGMKISIGHSLDRDLFSTLQPTAYYKVSRWIEVGMGLDYTIIPGADQDIAAVYLWSLGVMGRLVVKVPKSIIFLRPYIGIQTSYSHTAWEKKESIEQGYQCNYNRCPSSTIASTEVDWILKFEPVIGLMQKF